MVETLGILRSAQDDGTNAQRQRRCGWIRLARGRRTLEEGGPCVVVRCNNVVLTWLVRDRSIDPLDEEENGDEEEESGGVMVRCVGEDEEQHGDDGCEESEKFPAADFWAVPSLD
jgi:hypothetical protein